MVTKDELPDSAINLVVSSPKCSQFYLLPKIPKPDTPGCPVVSNVSCPTYNISKFLSEERSLHHTFIFPKCGKIMAK